MASSSDDWFQRLQGSIPPDAPSATSLISFAGSPGASDTPEQNRSIVGLIEPSWINPLFYPEGGYSQSIQDTFHGLPSSSSESLQALYSSVRGLNSDFQLFSFVLVANEDGQKRHGSRNHWRAMHSLTHEELTNSGALKYYSSAGTLSNYSNAVLPREIQASSAFDEFTLDILGAHTYNQFADIAIFIVPVTDLLTADGSTLDLPDYRLAPFPSAAQDLPLVVSSSYGSPSSMGQQSTHSQTSYWPISPNLPPLYKRIDNTGVVLTMSAGDQFSGLDFSNEAASAGENLYFNSQLTSSPILLAVGGSHLTINQGVVEGATAWRSPASSGRSGGNGGFSPAHRIPDSQRTSPWIRSFRRNILSASLSDAWTQPVSGGSLLAWWDSNGASLTLDDADLPEQELRFYSNAKQTKGLRIAPARSRHLPDLSNIASPANFLSFINKNGSGGKDPATLDLTQPGWSEAIVWRGDGGTSLASPATAALIAAANARRRQNHLADLSASELQYLLYQIPAGILTDVTDLQNPLPSLVSGYDAYAGYDFASGLGSVGNTGGSLSLLTYLGSQAMATLPQGSEGAADFAFKPSQMPLLLQRIQGENIPLTLVAMNGHAVAALLEAQESDPLSVSDRLLATLQAAAEPNQGQANAVAYSLMPLSSSWSAPAAGSLLGRPIGEFQQAEGVAISPDSLLDLGSLPDIFPASAAAPLSGSPAYYSLLVGDPAGAAHPLRLRPFAPNRGALLGQGGLLVGENGEASASLLLTPLQRPLLVADVAEALNTPQPGASLDLWLAGSSQAANLYGLFPTIDALGRLLDGEGEPLSPADPGYAARAIQAAFGDGSDSLLWDVPQAGATGIRHTSRWTAEGVRKEGRPLLEAVEPGRFYQHFVLSQPTPAERQALISRLLDNRLSADDLAHSRFASAPANPEGLSHAVGLREAGAFLSLGFEDSAGLGDRDFNDVVASWSVQDVEPQIGSLALADINADRIAELVAGSETGTVSTVLVVSAESGANLQIWTPFGASDTSGAVVASGDINGDGFDDVVAVRAHPSQTGAAGAGAEVAVLLGGKAYRDTATTGALPAPSQLNLQASAALGEGALSLAVRDLDADGYAEILLSAATSNAERGAVPLEVWSMASGSFQLVPGLAFSDSTGLDPRHGYSLAVGDLQGDGQAEVLLGDLHGANLFVGSVRPGGNGEPLVFASSVVLQPYGASHRSGVIPTAVSAQQVITQRPSGLAPTSLPWALSLPDGIAAGPTQPLLGGLGTAGALVVTSADPSAPLPSQVPLSRLLSIASSEPLVPIPWSAEAGAPIFASAGVSYPQPTDKQMNSGIPGAPSPVLVSAAAGTNSIALMSKSSTDNNPPWSTLTNSTNSISFTEPASAQQDWTQPWMEQQFAKDSTSNRTVFGMATTAVVSYTPPFAVNLNPLNLATPEQLLTDLPDHIEAFLADVVVPWNQEAIARGDGSPWGPGAPSSGNFPYDKPDSTGLPSFQPSFIPLASTAASPAPDLVRQFQQRLVSVALSNMGINYQHHYSPFWYSPASWQSALESTQQQSFQPAPQGRQTQGLDCTNFTSWMYNLSFGFWLNSATPSQATLSSVNVGWSPGTTLEVYSVKTAQEIYKSAKTDDEIIALLNENLQPGDILYLHGSPVDADPKEFGLESASHAIVWLNDNSKGSDFQFVSLPSQSSSTQSSSDAGGQQEPAPAFVIDSTGSESSNFLDQSYPNGIQIRQFDGSTWYLRNILAVHRWLTPENVQALNPQLPVYSIRANVQGLSEGSIGSTTHSFEISRSGDLSAPGSVAWAVSGEGPQAANSLDFVDNQLPSGVATFAAGQETTTIQINVVGDRMHEPDEAFTATLSKPQAGHISLAAASATGQILNDDGQEVSYTFTATPEVVYEGGTLRIGISTTNVAPGSRIAWQIGGAGISSSDFVSGQLSGSTSIGADGRAALSLAVAADATGDAGETALVRFFRDESWQHQVGESVRVSLQEPSVGVATDGNDRITGTAAAETLSGVPALSSLRGRQSLDVLTGADGDDLFVLGDALGPYYNDGSPALGSTDMAVITDFRPGDRIQLYGNSSLYSLVQAFHAGVAGLRITLRSGVSLPGDSGSTPLQGNEAIGFLQAASLPTVNLANPNQFTYVS